MIDPLSFPRRASQMAGSALTLAFIIFFALMTVSLANAQPMGEKKTEITTRSIQAVNMTSLASETSLTGWFSSYQAKERTTSSTTRTAASASSTATGTQELGPLRDARIAASSSSSPTTTFCSAFIKQCYITALDGQRGEVTVSHSCQRNGDKYPVSFTYSCRRGSENLTAQVLKAMGWAYHKPASTETIDKIRVVTELVEDIITRLSRTTTIITNTAATVTNTISTDVTNVETETIPSTTSTSTTAIPFTLSLTSTGTLTATITTTRTTSSTKTHVFIGTAEIPNYQIVVQGIEDEQNLERRAPSTFCLAYKIACENECMRVSSRVKDWICHGGRSTGYTYSLGCECQNGKRETQHALEAVAEDRKIASITILGTSTTFLTSTRTTTIPTQIASTRSVTKTTALVGRTVTHSTTSTKTSGAKIEYTGISTAVLTNKFVTIANTATETSTKTIYIPTTTNIVLAETGYMRAFDGSGNILGTVGQHESTIFAVLKPPAAAAQQFMAVRDNPTGLYQMAKLGEPTTVLKQYSNRSDPVFRAGTPYFAMFYIGPSSDCGVRGTSAGPAGGSLNKCETFMFSPLALDSTPGATGTTVEMRNFWINPLNSNPANVSGYWSLVESSIDQIYIIADKTVFRERFPSWAPIYFTLRFPYTA